MNLKKMLRNYSRYSDIEVGVPTRQLGWMSEFDELLDLPRQWQGKVTRQHAGAPSVFSDNTLSNVDA